MVTGYRSKLGLFFVLPFFLLSGCLSLPAEDPGTADALKQANGTASPVPTVAPGVPTPTPTRAPTPTPVVSSGSCSPAYADNMPANTLTYRFSGTTTAPYGFAEYLPSGYASLAAGCKWPVILMLHGLGETGDGRDGNLQKVIVHGPQKGTGKPAIIIVPQSPGWWDSGTINRMVDYIFSTYNADPGRLYVTGLSMGGGGTWDYARAYPSRVAAIMPICGASNTNGTAAERQALDTLPIWAFHAVNDGTVPSGNTNGFFNNWAVLYGALNQVPTGYNRTSDQTGHLNKTSKMWEWSNGRTTLGPSGQSYELDKHYTLYPDGSHDSWSRSYADPAIYRWLFSKKR